MTWLAGQESERTEPTGAKAQRGVGGAAAAGGHHTFVSPRNVVALFLRREQQRLRGKLRACRRSCDPPHMAPPNMTKQGVELEQFQRYAIAAAWRARGTAPAPPVWFCKTHDAESG